MNLTNISSNVGDLNAQVTQKDLKQIREYLQQLNDELRYQLTHVDESNMTQDMVNAIQAGGKTQQAGTTGLQRMVAGLRINGSSTQNSIILTLSSGELLLNSVQIYLGSLISNLQDSIWNEVLETIYPVGGIYSIEGDQMPDEVLGFGTWEDITPSGFTAYKTYKRVEDLESEELDYE